MFRNLELLPRADVEVVTAANLISRFMGNTGPNVVEAMRRAKGGILFIDEAYGMVAKHGSYGSEAIQALLDNITLPEFRGNLIVILAGYADHVEKLFESNAGFRSRFDKRRLDFPEWSPSMATRATIRKIEQIDGIALTAEAKEWLPKMYRKLADLPDWGSARDVFRNIIPTMYSKRSTRVCSIMRMEKANAEPGAVVKVASKRGQKTEVPHPYDASDVLSAFESSIKSRGGTSTVYTPSKYSTVVSAPEKLPESISPRIAAPDAAAAVTSTVASSPKGFNFRISATNSVEELNGAIGDSASDNRLLVVVSHSLILFYLR